MDSSSSSSGAGCPFDAAIPAIPESGVGAFAAFALCCAFALVGCAFGAAGDGLTGAGSTGFGSSTGGAGDGCFDGGSCVLAGCDTGCDGEGVLTAGCDTDTDGELVSLALLKPGGGGRGAMPTPLLSLAAAAAAADAYLSGWPVGIVGKGAGFILGSALPFVFPGKLECNVESAGNGDFICTLGLRAGAGASEIDADLPFPLMLLLLCGSISGGSSVVLCAS